MKDDVNQRHQAAWTEQQRWFWRWDRVFELMVPERSQRYRDNTGDSVAPYIYDTTAAEKAENLANQMISVLTPPGVAWLRLTPGPDLLGDARLSMAQKLEPINQVLAYHIHRANFVVAVQPAFLDMMVTAGAVMVEPAPSGSGFTIKCIPINELAYCEDIYGRIRTVYRTYKVRARQILGRKEWTEKLPPLKLVELEAAPDKEIEMRSAIEPDGEQFHYSEWMKDCEVYFEDRKVKRNPYLIFRWSAVASNPYGRGPGLIKYHDILNLNTLSEYQLKAAGFDLLGIWGKKDDSVINTHTINLYPGAQILMDSVSMADPSMRRIDSTDGTRYRIGQDTLNSLREVIIKAFYGDKFSPIVGDKMSATEITARARDLAQALGAVWGRIEAEFLRPFAYIAVGILKDQGAFNVIPGMTREISELLNIDHKQLEIRFLGTLSQAQYMQSAQGLLQFMSAQQVGMQTDPKLQVLIDTTAGYRMLAEAMTIPAQLIRTDTQMNNIVKRALEDAAAQQAAAAQAGQVVT